MMKYNEKIVALRKANGFTQEGFAKAVGVTRQAVYKWEVGDSYPEAEKLIAIKMLFGISIDDLLDDNYEVVVERVKKPRKRRAAAPAVTEEAPAEFSVVEATEEEAVTKEEPTVAAATAEEDEFDFTVTSVGSTERSGNLFDLFRRG